MKLIGFAHVFPKAGVLAIKSMCHLERRQLIMVEDFPGVHRIDSMEVDHERRGQIARNTDFALRSSTIDPSKVGKNHRAVLLLEEGDVETIAVLQADMRRGREGADVSRGPGHLHPGPEQSLSDGQI